MEIALKVSKADPSDSQMRKVKHLGHRKGIRRMRGVRDERDDEK